MAYESVMASRFMACAPADPLKALKLREAYRNAFPPLILEHPTVVEMRRVRRERAERLRALRLRPWWRKVWDGVVYVVSGREP